MQPTLTLPRSRLNDKAHGVQQAFCVGQAFERTFPIKSAFCVEQALRFGISEFLVLDAYS